MALHFARKNAWHYPYESIEQALAAMEFSDLSSFIEVARVNNRTLRTVDDYCDVARQYLRRMSACVVHGSLLSLNRAIARSESGSWKIAQRAVRRW
jgi:hypothetical protein